MLESVSTVHRRFWITIWVVAALLMCASFITQVSGWDIAVERWYWNGHGFIWADAWLTETFSHKWLKLAIWMLFLYALFNAFFSSFLHLSDSRLTKVSWNLPRSRWIYFAAMLLIIAALVGLLKSISHEPCPVATTLFGGKLPYVLWYVDAWPQGLKSGKCFPAGHASAGFALFAMYFMLRDHAPRAARWSLLAPLFIGGFMAHAQHMRGQHFLSQSFATAAIAWGVAGIGYGLLLKIEKKIHDT